MEIKIDIKKIIDLRQKLHKFPELSGKEHKTTETLTHFFKRYNPDKVYHFANGSVAFEFGQSPEPAIVFRAELDALPIDESLDLPYSSVNPGVSHKCGHDGHMAILAGLAEVFSRQKKLPVRAVMLYQSAEETLQGAVEVLSDPLMNELNPGIFIGFHNVPGFQQNAILLKSKDITAYVTGLRVTFKGQSAHAVDATKNKSLALAVMRVIQFIDREFPLLKISKKSDINITHITYGKPTFGISPDNAVIHLTLRAFNNDDLEELIDAVEEQLKLIALANKLQWDFEYTEDAPGIYNDPELTQIAIQTARQLGRDIIELNKPFSWGEDFGYYTIKYKGLYFGIGAGKDFPALHTPGYDFPDEIIYPTIEFLYNLYLSLTHQNLK